MLLYIFDFCRNFGFIGEIITDCTPLPIKFYKINLNKNCDNHV